MPLRHDDRIVSHANGSIPDRVGRRRAKLARGTTVILPPLLPALLFLASCTDIPEEDAAAPDEPASTEVSLELESATTAGDAAAPIVGSDAFAIPGASGSIVPDALSAEEIAGVIDRRVAEVGGDRAHLLVQLDAPPEIADVERLAERGIVLLDRVTKRTWYAAVTADAAIVGDDEGVRWVGVPEAEDKLSSDARDRESPEHMLRDGGREAYSVLFHKDVTAEEVLALQGEIGFELESFDERSFSVLRSADVVIAPDRLLELAGADIVLRVEPAPPPDIDFNRDNAQPLSNVDDVQDPPYELDGSGIAVGVWEAGDVLNTIHLDLAGRVFVQPDQADSTDDHAMHVGGTIGSSGDEIPETEGMAPNVTISSWDSKFDTAEMIDAASAEGDGLPVRASNHSYGIPGGWTWDPDTGKWEDNGTDIFGWYQGLSRAFDSIVVDEDLVVVIAAGNDRNDESDETSTPPRDCTTSTSTVEADCISTRATAKNVITVGAMKSSSTITDFSSYGPTNDGRMKPDIVAHGFDLISLLDGADDASGPNSGTSMATPVVTGIVALLLQDAAALAMPLDPSAVRALLFHTANDVDGTGQANPGPDFSTGWGIADAKGAVDTLRGECLKQATLNGTGLGNAWEQTFEVPQGLSDLRVTLVWDDPESSPPSANDTTPLLINDLDLRLLPPGNAGTPAMPWVLDPANPDDPATTGDDTRNPVEQVFVSNPVPGTWTARVLADPGNLPFPQAFTLACIPGNVTPAVDVGPDRSVDEGTTEDDIEARITDPDVGDTLEVSWTEDGAHDPNLDSTLDFSPGTHVVDGPDVLRGDDAVVTVVASAQDTRNGTAKGAPGTDSLTVTFNNVAPSVDSLTIAPDSIWPGATVTATVTFSDPGWEDDHFYAVMWGDTTDSDGTIDEPIVAQGDIGVASATKDGGYALPDEYQVEACVSDDDGGVSCSTVPVTVELSPDMPGVFDSGVDLTFFTWTGTIPNGDDWKDGTGAASIRWIYESQPTTDHPEPWLFFFLQTPNDVPNYNPDLPDDVNDNNLAIAVKTEDFQTWIWCGGIGGCHPQYGPASQGSLGILHPWMVERIEESEPHIFAVLETLYGD